MFLDIVAHPVAFGAQHKGVAPGRQRLVQRYLRMACQADSPIASLGNFLERAGRWAIDALAFEDALRQFEDHMKGLPEVRECHMLNGEIDFILKIVSKDLQSFQEFLTSKLTPAPNVASVKTSLTIRTAKQMPGVPLE